MQSLEKPYSLLIAFLFIMIYYKFLRLESIYYFCEIDYIFKTEQWLPVPGYEKYMVSDLGRVKSLDRVVIHFKNGRKLKEKILRQKEHVYLKVSLCSLSIAKTETVQKLVSIAFLNHTPDGYRIIINHKNCIKYDNRKVNLELISQRENMTKEKTNRVGTSIYTGVHWCITKRRWIATIWIDKKKIRIGGYNTEIEAYKSYQNKLQSIS